MIITTKGIYRPNTYIGLLPQAAYTAATSTLCVADRAGVQPRPQPSPCYGLRTAAIQPYVV